MQFQRKNEAYAKFYGINNVSDTSQLVVRNANPLGASKPPMARMQEAINVDLFDDGFFARRDGYSLELAGSYHSLWEYDSNFMLAVNNGNLVRINQDFSKVVLLENVGNNRMSYEKVLDSVYFTNSFVIGKLVKGIASLLNTVNRDFKATLPAGNIIRFFQGSIYVVRGNALFISDVLNHEIYDRRWGFKLFDSSLTMFEPVTDGFFVSDEQFVFFMKRTGSTDAVVAVPIFVLEKLYDAAIPGTAVRVTDITTPGDKKYQHAVLWVSKTTFCVGGDGGHFETIQEEVYALPDSVIGTAMFRESEEVSQYVAILR
jgi:hypothetical protein